MNILVICQYYYPEPVRISDICEELVKRGNNVTVVTGIPNYPMGEIYDEYKENCPKYEKINGVDVYRCYTIPRKTGSIRRLLNYYSFAISSAKFCKKLNKDFDVVLVNQLSPVMMAYGGLKYKKKYNKKLILYCLDLWPESLKVGGIKEKSIIYKFFHRVSRKVYSSCDKILITSKSFKRYLMKNFEIENDRIEYLPQYAENLFNIEDCKKQKSNIIDLMFAGNMGTTQSLDTIIIAAEILKQNKNLYFHFVGDGTEYDRLKKLSEDKQLNNIIFHGRKNINEMPKFYSMADAMLVTLSGNSEVSSTLPGKVQTYMAAGKPIIGAINGETKDVIEDAQCGFCGEADNPEQLVSNIEAFINSKDNEYMGRNAYNYYKKNYDKDIFITKLLNELE